MSDTWCHSLGPLSLDALCGPNCVQLFIHGLVNDVKAQGDHKFCALPMIGFQLHIAHLATPSPVAKILSEDCSESPLYRSQLGDVPQLAHVVGSMWVFGGVTGSLLK